MGNILYREVQAMETVTNDAVQRRATSAYRGETEETFRVLFTTREVLALSGLSRNTLKFWRLKKWVTPVGRSQVGHGHEYLYSGWQTIGLCILGAAQRTVRNLNSYVGRCGVVRAMEVLAGLSDEMLLPEGQQDPRLAENIAAELAQAALTSHESAELTPEMVEAVARVLSEIDAACAS